MTFTDDDLRRLKVMTIEQPEVVDLWSLKLEALLARLEAAEAVIAQHDLYETEAEMEAWRKAAGK
jgi:hypothetical protein